MVILFKYVIIFIKESHYLTTHNVTHIYIIKIKSVRDIKHRETIMQEYLFFQN